MHSNRGLQAQFRSNVQRANERIGGRMQHSAPIFSLSNFVSALIGLGIGLFLAWQVWPVEWAGVRPTHLDADAKAQYLASVADAYIASGEDANALMLAQRRLQGMDLTTDIPAAVTYFQRAAQVQTDSSNADADAYQQALQADGNIRVSYIMRLAAGLGMDVQSPSALNADLLNSRSGEAGVPQAAVENSAAEPQSAAQSTSSAQMNTSDTFRLLLSGLTALLLVLGGLYILLRLARSNNWLPFSMQGASAGALQSIPPAESMSERELISEYSQEPVRVDPFEEDDLPIGNPAQSLHGRQSEDPSSLDNRSSTGYTLRPPAETVRPASFIHDEEDDEYDDSYADDLNDDIGDDRHAAGSYVDNYRYADRLAEDGESAPGGQAEDVSSPVDDERAAIYRRPAASGARSDERTSYQVDRPSTDRYPVDRSAADRYRTDEPDDIDDDWEADEGDGLDVATIMEQYITHYEHGVLDYEERRHVMSGNADAAGASLGEYGIGVNYKNGILGADASQVIAMDVWLFDKTDDKNAVYKTQVLLSERANQLDELKEVLENDPVGSELLLPSEGMSFQLKGKNLLLDCEILLVEFTEDGEAPGVFDALEVQFTLRHT